jgi:hypothetical protein
LFCCLYERLFALEMVSHYIVPVIFHPGNRGGQDRFIVARRCTPRVARYY